MTFTLIKKRPKDRIDINVSEELASLVDALPRECYMNSLRVLRQFPKLDLFYVEGWVADNPLVFEHGWLETRKGVIIDVTLAVVPKLSDDRAYFSGYVYHREEALSLFVAKIKRDEPHVFPLRANENDPFGMKDRNYYSAMIYANIHTGVPKEFFFGGNVP